MDTKQVERALEIENANRFQMNYKQLLMDYASAAYVSAAGLTEFNLVYIQANLHQALACCRKIELADLAIQQLYFQTPGVTEEKEMEPQRAQTPLPGGTEKKSFKHEGREDREEIEDWGGHNINWIGRLGLWMADKFG